MKRTSSGSDSVSFTNAPSSSSFMPRITTQLTLTRPVPCGASSATAASIAPRTRARVRGLVARDRLEAVGQERVERDVHVREAGGDEAREPALEQQAVGRDAERAHAVERREPRREVDDVAAHERLAARQPDLARARADEEAREAHDLVAREQRLLRREVDALGRHAVCTAEVASLRDRDAQVVVEPPEAVGEHRRVRRRRAGCSTAGAAITVAHGRGAGFRANSAKLGASRETRACARDAFYDDARTEVQQHGGDAKGHCGCGRIFSARCGPMLSEMKTGPANHRARQALSPARV